MRLRLGGHRMLIQRIILPHSLLNFQFLITLPVLHSAQNHGNNLFLG